MPDVLIVNDNASISSSRASSFVSFQQKQQQNSTFRRHGSRMSRWVSRKVSRVYLNSGRCGYDDQKKKMTDEDAVYESYTAYCDAFTSSAKTENARLFCIRGGEDGMDHHSSSSSSSSSSGSCFGNTATDCDDMALNYPVDGAHHPHHGNTNDNVQSPVSPTTSDLSPPSLVYSQTSSRKRSSSTTTTDDNDSFRRPESPDYPPAAATPSNMPPAQKPMSMDDSINEKLDPPLGSTDVPLSPSSLLSLESKTKYVGARASIPNNYSFRLSRLPETTPSTVLTPCLYEEERKSVSQEKRSIGLRRLRSFFHRRP